MGHTNHEASPTTDSIGVPESYADGTVNWQQLCRELTAERDQLKTALAKVQRERDVYLESLYVLTREEFDFDKDALLAAMGTQKPLEEFIADLERMPGA
jgi:hypothetical protein